MIHAEHLRQHVIAPTLQHIGLDSMAAQNLLLGTAAVESHMGTYLVQLGGGPARGIYQMEPATHQDIWSNWLFHRAGLSRAVMLLSSPTGERVEQLVWNLRYATAMARCHYRRVPEALPGSDDVLGMARYYKRYYNTPAGKGTEGAFCDAYFKYVAGR